MTIEEALKFMNEHNLTIEESIMLKNLIMIPPEEILNFIKDNYDVETTIRTVKQIKTESINKLSLCFFYCRLRQHICRLKFDIKNNEFTFIDKDKSLQEKHKFYKQKLESGYPQDFIKKFEKHFNLKNTNIK